MGDAMRAAGTEKHKVGRPPCVETFVPQPPAWDSSVIAAQLQDILDALEVPPIDAESRGIFQRILYRQKYFGGDAKGRVIFIIRCITESSGNEGALIGPVVSAVSSCLTPELTNHGLELLEAFDQIPLMSVLETMRSLDLFSEKSIGWYYSIAIRNKLAAILEPAARPATKPVQVKREPKPPRALTRVPGVEAMVALGVKLLELRSTAKSNREFGRLRNKLFDVDTMTGVRAMMVARAYGDRPEIYRRLSWKALRDLSSPSIQPSLRRDLEARILADERIGGPQIRRARLAHSKADGRPRLMAT
jgi:hypothetical protein